jgi:hypothetical protein
MKFVVRIHDHHGQPGRTVHVDQADVAGFIAGYTAALDVELDLRGVDAGMPERHRLMLILQIAERSGVLEYVGVIADDGEEGQ